VALTVRDTGVGMSPDVLARACDPFFTTKPRGKGTSLGLSQVYGFIRQSGGTVHIESEPDHGTSVRIYLPCSTHLGISDRTMAVEDGRSERATILVVDDDVDVLESVRGMLDDQGYRVIAAESAEVALASLDGADIDLALVDLAMPGTSGIDVAARLLECRPDIRVLFSSGYPDLVVSQMQRVSGEYLISKPYRGRELSEKIKSILIR
jgi:CheY-like chemotaxis protein